MTQLNHKIHQKVNAQLADGIVDRFTDNLIKALFFKRESIPIYNFKWEEITSEFLDRLTRASIELEKIDSTQDFAFLTIITERVKVDIFMNSISVSLEMKSLISKEYKALLEKIFLYNNFLVEFPDNKTSVITLR
jgi:hypothetical protein